MLTNLDMANERGLDAQTVKESVVADKLEGGKGERHSYGFVAVPRFLLNYFASTVTVDKSFN